MAAKKDAEEAQGAAPGQHVAEDYEDGRMADEPQAFILERARSEVHLLLDNISANPEVTIAALVERDPPKGLPKDWIEQVCKITWPPTDDPKGVGNPAEQAALLIKTRDYLNGLAKPASGATIAFTLLVTQEEGSSRRRRAAADTDKPTSPSRSSLAADAYPDLVPRARYFRRLLSWIIWLPLFWLALTLLVSWYLAIGNAALSDYAATKTRLGEAEVRVSQAQSGLSRGAVTTAGAQVVPAPGTAIEPVVYQQDICASIGRAYPSAELRDACRVLAEQRTALQVIREGLEDWSVTSTPESASWVAILLGSAVLPVLYGVLGAIAAVVLSLSRKIKGSLLSPRDVQLSFQQLALGALIGACVSLFVGPPGGDGETLLGPVALSTSAISFVAGFGVDSVFQAIEALISRILNIAPGGGGPPPSSRGRS